jgi:hypothetical protein
MFNKSEILRARIHGAGIAALALASIMTASAVERTYRYFRFVPTDVRGNTNLIQLSEFKFYDSAGQEIPLTDVTVTSPLGDFPAMESPAEAVDNDVATKWLDRNYVGKDLIFDFGEDATQTIDAYNYFTGNDAAGRDPVSWSIEGADDLADEWTVLDRVIDFVPTDVRQVVATSDNFVFPEVVPPGIEFFEFNDLNLAAFRSLIVPNGEVEVFIETLGEGDISLTVGDEAPVTPDQGFNVVPIPDDRDLTLTLTISNDGGSASETLQVRSEETTTRSVQYIRFTPTTTRQPQGSVVHLAELNFFGTDGFEIPVNDVSDDTGTNAIGADEGALKLIDDDAATKWYSGNSNPIIFDFGSVQEVDGYSFTTAADLDFRDPVNYILEGSLNGTDFFIMDVVQSMDLAVPLGRGIESQILPLPVTDSQEPIVEFSSDRRTVTADQDVILTWEVTADATPAVEILPELASVALSGEEAVSLDANSTFILSATNPLGRVVQKSLDVSLATPFDGELLYPDFDDPSGINTVGTAEFVDLSDQFLNDPDAERLRLTSIGYGEDGNAWFYEPIDLSQGFETTFVASITHPLYFNGADGMSFVIQNSPDGDETDMGQRLFIAPEGTVDPGGSTGPSLAIILRTIGDDSNAAADVRVNGVLLESADLGSDPGLGIAKGVDGNYLLIPGGNGGVNYEVSITYVPGDLDVSIEGVPVFTDLDVNLGDVETAVLDEDGSAYVGFGGRTGGLGENHDVLSWTFSTDVEIVDPPVGGDLEIASYSFDFSAQPAQLTLTFVSEAGVSYDVTSSGGLETFTPLQSGILGEEGTTTVTVDLPADTGGFFRVEEVADEL